MLEHGGCNVLITLMLDLEPFLVIVTMSPLSRNRAVQCSPCMLDYSLTILSTVVSVPYSPSKGQVSG